MSNFVPGDRCSIPWLPFLHPALCPQHSQAVHKAAAGNPVPSHQVRAEAPPVAPLKKKKQKPHRHSLPFPAAKGSCTGFARNAQESVVLDQSFGLYYGSSYLFGVSKPSFHSVKLPPRVMCSTGCTHNAWQCFPKRMGVVAVFFFLRFQRCCKCHRQMKLCRLGESRSSFWHAWGF